MAKVEFLTPVGRLVSGDAWKPQTTDMQGQPLKIKSGPNAGQPGQRYVLNIAVAKNDPELGTYYALLMKAAREAWPQFFNGAPGPDGQPQCTHPQFALKLMDGDGVDGNGKPNNQKEGHAGHWIIKTSSSYAPRCFYKDRYAAQDEIKDPSLLVRGDYVRISGTLEGNNQPTKPGMYVNCGMVALWAKGTPIVSGPDAATAFGGAAAGVLPAGAFALPAAGPAMPGMAAMAGNVAPSPTGFVPPAAMPGMGLPGGAPVAQPNPTYVQPNPGVLMPGMAPPAAQSAYAAPMAMPGFPQQQAAPGFPQPQAMPGMPGLPAMPAAAPAGPVLTPAGVATGLSHAQMLANGWNDAALRQHGYIV